MESMENFISGYPGCEFQIRSALAEVVGKEKSELFFDKVSAILHVFARLCSNAQLLVSRVFLPGRRCQIFQIPRLELHSYCFQLQTFRR